MTFGVLALQGDFEKHFLRLQELGEAPLYVRSVSDLSRVDALIIPGGESSALLKLLDAELLDLITSRAQNGMPIFATCAGLILLCRHVSNPEQHSLKLIDVDVQRNAYGRQIDSFISKGSCPVADRNSLCDTDNVETVFIRAPRITRVGPDVEILLTHAEGFSDIAEPIMVKQGKIVAMTFHPELSQDPAVHSAFVKLCSRPDQIAKAV